MPTTTNGGVKLHWEESGQGSPLLLIMGHRYSSGMWYPVLDALSARHRLIWFDNRGTGRSGVSARVSVKELAGDALAVMDAAGVEQAHVHGVSMGGVLTLETALLAPKRVTSMVLGCTGILSAEKPRAPGAMRVLYFAPAWMLRLLLGRGDHGYGSAAPAERVAHDQAVVSKDVTTARGGAAQARAMAEYCVAADAIRGLTMPALVLHGNEDKTVPYAYGEELAATLPNSRLVTLEGAGHNYFIARGPEATAATLAFLAEVDAGKAAA